MKKKNIAIVVQVLFVIIYSSNIFADGLAVKSGRYANDKNIIELKLTDSQNERIKKHYKPRMIMYLSEEQQKFIQSKFELPGILTMLEVSKIKDLVGDCTCGDTNLAFPFKDHWVEIPTRYLYSDWEALELKKEMGF